MYSEECGQGACIARSPASNRSLGPVVGSEATVGVVASDMVLVLASMAWRGWLLDGWLAGCVEGPEIG